MTDIQVSSCCGSGMNVDDGELTCRKCEQPCEAVWEVIIWDDNGHD